MSVCVQMLEECYDMELYNWVKVDLSVAVRVMPSQHVDMADLCHVRLTQASRLSADAGSALTAVVLSSICWGRGLQDIYSGASL